MAEGTKYVTNSLTRDRRRICVYGVCLHITMHDGKITLDPCFKRMNQLMELLKDPHIVQVQWNAEDKRWEEAE